jgi:hypothetical protein
MVHVELVREYKGRKNFKWTWLPNMSSIIHEGVPRHGTYGANSSVWRAWHMSSHIRSEPWVSTFMWFLQNKWRSEDLSMQSWIVLNKNLNAGRSHQNLSQVSIWPKLFQIFSEAYTSLISLRLKTWKSKRISKVVFLREKTYASSFLYPSCILYVRKILNELNPFCVHFVQIWLAFQIFLRFIFRLYNKLFWPKVVLPNLKNMSNNNSSLS